MPLTNGDAGTSPARLMPGKALDHTTALEVLASEDQDGIDVRELLDSKNHGGLTYNDFLILPGYIGQSFAGENYSIVEDLTCTFRLCRFRGCS